MFESCVVAEYLRRNPAEVKDYLDYGHILRWKRYQQLLTQSPVLAKRLNPQLIVRLEGEYKRVLPRFTDKNGRVRSQWHRKPLSQMAADLDMQGQYELSFTVASSVHHANAEGILAQIKMTDEGVLIQQPPSLNWLREALIAGHIYLLEALDSLNECTDLGCDAKLKAASEECHRIWRG